MVERRVRAEAAVASEGGGAAGTPLDARGWLAPLAPVVPARGIRGDVWAFEPVLGARAKDEPLTERVVEALLARTIPYVGDLVNATAGRGAIGLVARRHGVRSWSRDLAPKAPFVHRADVRKLLWDRPPGVVRPGGFVVLVTRPVRDHGAVSVATLDDWRLVIGWVLG